MPVFDDKGPKLVWSEFSGRMIPISCEAWRHECEVAFLLGLPIAMQAEMLEGSPNEGHPNQLGIRSTRGESAVTMLRLEISRLKEIRRLRPSHRGEDRRPAA
ncbi:DUF7696 family protein [Bosea sp. PAMC 26642]|uniref:DUF7696 family protein n=1 Tax=Bosea sp. (strain PAMC 26642) TaxID=1792307 RepID=UPI003FA42595